MAQGSDLTLDDFVTAGLPNSLHRHGFGLYTIDSVVAVDRVCLYENLESELETVRTCLGIPEPLQLPPSPPLARTGAPT